MEEGPRQEQEMLAIMANNTIQALQKYMEETGASQTAVGRACGISGPVISQILRGEYAGDVPKTLQKIHDFLTLEDERKEAFTSTEFVRTEQAEDVIAVCSMAHWTKKIGLVLGRSGLGKTTTLREYSSTKSGAKMITASTFNCSKGALAELLVSALNVSMTYTTLTKAVDQIVKKIGSGALIIIDEAHHLPKETLDGLRYIHDVAKMGLVLSGTVALYERMCDRRIGLNYDQLASRVIIRRTLSEKVDKGDIKKILDRTAPGWNGEVLEYCWGKANGPGAYRAMTNYLQVAMMKAKGKKEGLALKHFKAAEEVLMV